MKIECFNEHNVHQSITSLHVLPLWGRVRPKREIHTQDYSKELLTWRRRRIWHNSTNAHIATYSFISTIKLIYISDFAYNDGEWPCKPAYFSVCLVWDMNSVSPEGSLRLNQVFTRDRWCHCGTHPRKCASPVVQYKLASRFEVNNTTIV
jgi:hypothetical protein